MSPDVSARLIADPRVAAVTLTGSERAGAFVAAEAGKALKKSVLELGGSDPFVVLADADLDLAVKHAVTGRLMTAGQTCIAPKRFLVDETVVGDFQSKLVEALEAVTIGDPREEGVGLGPLAREDILENLERQVAATVAEGAELKTGGTRLDQPGYFFPPTVLGGVKPGMTAFVEETLVRSSRSRRSPPRTRPSSSPTTRATGSARPCGPRTPSAARPSRGGSSPAWCR